MEKSSIQQLIKTEQGLGLVSGTKENSKLAVDNSFNLSHSKSIYSSENCGYSFRGDQTEHLQRQKIHIEPAAGNSSNGLNTHLQFGGQAFIKLQSISSSNKERQNNDKPKGGSLENNILAKRTFESDSKENNSFIADKNLSIDNKRELSNISLIKPQRSFLENQRMNIQQIPSKENIKKIWEKMRIVKEKVKEKKKEDFERITQAILKNDDELALATLTNEDFKYFYSDCLNKSDLFLEMMVMNLRFELLLKVLEDQFYVFDNDFCFRYILSLYKRPGKTYFDQFGKLNDISGCSFSKRKSQSKEGIANDQEEKDKLLKTNIENPNIHKAIFSNLIRRGLYNKEESKVKILAWLLADLQCYDLFTELISKYEYFIQEKESFNNFQTPDDIKAYCQDYKSYHNTIEKCLNNGFEDLAIALVDNRQYLFESQKIDEIAAKQGMLKILKFIWEKTFGLENDIEKSSCKKRSSFQNFTSSLDKKSIISIYPRGRSGFYNNNSPVITINKLIPLFKQKVDGDMMINRMLKWKGLENDTGLLKTLFDYDCFEQISSLIATGQISKWNCSKDYFMRVIEKEQTELILFFVQNRECRMILSDLEVQSLIVNKYMRHGEMLYYGAEMLGYIYKNQWKSQLTKDLCKNIIKTVKTKDILNCHSSILTCLLLCEFLTQIKEISITNVSRCEKVMNELKEYCKNIQEANPQESYIRYLMKQKDTRNRSAFQIASENSIYELLETAEIGTIVKKMWNGNMSNNGFFAASSLHRYIDTDVKTMDPFYSFDSLDTSKVYFFQLAVWTDSCSLRYWPEGVSTVGLIVTYNIFIYLLVSSGQLLNTYSELDESLRILLGVYIVWVTSVFLGIINMMIFDIKAKRNFKVDAWTGMDLIMFLFAWLLLLDTRSLCSSYKGMELSQAMEDLMWDLEINFTKSLKANVGHYSGSVAFILRTLILTTNDLFVWLRVTGILLTYKEMGPVIRMILRMALLLFKYLLIIILFLACCAAIFTAIFNRYSNQFQDFSTSIVTLFGGFVNNFQTTNFDKKFQAFGSVMVMVYVCIAGVLLVNLLIAVLANVYEKLSRVVDASHRAVLIQYFRKYKWDNDYGYLIFLTTPLNLINYVTMIFSLCCGQNKKKYNEFISECYYFVFYFPFLLSAGIAYTLILLPFCYIKGIIFMIKYQLGLKVLKLYKILHVGKWILGGIPFLVFVYFRDVFDIIRNVFRKVDTKDTDFSRIKKNITNQDVVIFLKFIHSKITNEKKRDIHSLFMAYLQFEASEKAEMNELRTFTQTYMKQLNSVGNATVNSRKEMQNFEASFIRKNLMVIEILENFIMDDELGGSAVDIEKMRKLLPLTMNIKNYHIRRLIHSDVHALNQAMTKLKVSKNIFLQYQLVNKIMASAMRLDKEIDSEILKIQRNKLSEKKNEGDIKNEKEEDESSKIGKEKREDVELMKKFEILIRQILDNVNETINSKKKEEKSSRVSKNYEEAKPPGDSDVKSSKIYHEKRHAQAGHNETSLDTNKEVNTTQGPSILQEELM